MTTQCHKGSDAAYSNECYQKVSIFRRVLYLVLVDKEILKKAVAGCCQSTAEKMRKHKTINQDI